MVDKEKLPHADRPNFVDYLWKSIKNRVSAKEDTVQKLQLNKKISCVERSTKINMSTISNSLY